MKLITTHPQQNKNSPLGTESKVLLGGKHVGNIRRVSDGWKYFPKAKGCKSVGETFYTYGGCVASLCAVL